MSATATAMRGAVLEAPRTFGFAKAAMPEPGPGEVRVRIEGCGVCGSDLPVWEGRAWFDYPREAGAPGHEGWGTVDAVGDEVELAVGTRVAMLGFRSYAEYEVLAASAVAVLPPALDGLPFPGEALGCAVNVVRRAQVHSGDLVAVVGVGFLGALIVQLAKAHGATVLATSRRQFAQDVAAEAGADHVLGLDETSVDSVGELTGGRLCDVVIEATGMQRPLDLAGELTTTRGRLVVAGFHQDGRRTVDMGLWNWRGIDVVNAHEREPDAYMSGLREAVDLVADGTLDPRPLYTHSFELGRVGDAFSAATERPDGFLKALVTA